MENTIRWRYSKDKDGEEIKESNCRFVRWSDGSLSMHLGNEVFDVVGVEAFVFTDVVPFIVTAVAVDCTSGEVDGFGTEVPGGAGDCDGADDGELVESVALLVPTDAGLATF